jgi:hypothetical protein
MSGPGARFRASVAARKGSKDMVMQVMQVMEVMEATEATEAM